jgi:hypothetical protein
MAPLHARLLQIWDIRREFGVTGEPAAHLN